MRLHVSQWLANNEDLADLKSDPPESLSAAEKRLKVSIVSTGSPAAITWWTHREFWWNKSVASGFEILALTLTYRQSTYIPGILARDRHRSSSSPLHGNRDLRVCVRSPRMILIANITWPSAN